MKTLSAAELRAEILASRKALSADDVQRLSAATLARLRAAWGPMRERLERGSARGVALYRSFGKELDLRALEPELAAAGFELYFPRVIDRDRSRLELVRAPEADVSEAWKTGAFGIEEPHPDLPGISLAQAKAKIGLVFVPGVAFGLKGQRIGMGAGYYDRILGELPDALRVSVAYDFQLRPVVPQEPWDQAVDWIMTEAREVRVESRFSAWLRR